MPTFTKWLVPIATLLLEIPIGVCPAYGLPAVIQMDWIVG